MITFEKLKKYAVDHPGELMCLIVEIHCLIAFVVVTWDIEWSTLEYMIYYGFGIVLGFLGVILFEVLDLSEKIRELRSERNDQE